MSKFVLIIFVFGIIGWNLSFQLPPLKTRIIGGQEANIQEVPYQLSLWYLEQFIGGASIIGARWAITAAHCVSEKGAIDKNFKVGAGHALKENGTFYKILKIIIHKSYDKYANNDIALLQVNGDFQFGSYVKIVNLPEPNFEPYSGLEVTVSGWGRTEAKSLNFLNVMDSEKLKKVVVSIVSRKDCKAKYKKLNRPITENMVCAGDLVNGCKDACINDSGGPMVANNKLYGIVSWGNGCGSKDYPGVYTNVAKYVSWIKKYVT